MRTLLLDSMSTCFHLDTSQDFDSGPTLDEIDNAITDRNTWAWMSAVNCVAFEAEYLGRWGEGSWAGQGSRQFECD